MAVKNGLISKINGFNLLKTRWQIKKIYGGSGTKGISLMFKDRLGGGLFMKTQNGFIRLELNLTDSGSNPRHHQKQGV